MKKLTTWEKNEILRIQLENERSTFISHWRDISDFIKPRRARFFVQDANQGDRRNQKINDNTATLASRTLRAGMMSGITSPARPWFRLTTPDPKMSEVQSIKQWLHNTSTNMASVFLKSNLYNVLPPLYGDLGDFGTGAIFVEEDFNSVMRFYSLPIGSYSIAQDETYRVNVFFREFRMTVRQLISKFGIDDPNKLQDINWDKFSSVIKGLWETGHLEAWVDVCHVIRPNENYDPKRLESKFKKYISIYYEKGTSDRNHAPYMTYEGDKVLSEMGYEYFPVLAPRWELTGEDVYATSCPGMEALGDVKQLQLGEKRQYQAIEKMINPPMVADPELRKQKTSILPGDITYTSGANGFRAAHEINFRVDFLEQKLDQTRMRIKRAYYEDLFLMLASTDRRQITAREIEERHEEKLLALGPVLEQLNQDLLDPLIDIAFIIMDRQGLIEPPPPELQGMDLKVEYISIMAQAQKLVGLAGIERFASFANNVIAANPSASVKVDTEQLLDVVADVLSIPPGIVRSDEDVAEIKAAQAQAQQQQMRMQQMSEMSKAAANLGKTPLGQDTALDRIIDQAQAGSLLPQ